MGEIVVNGIDGRIETPLFPYLQVTDGAAGGDTALSTLAHPMSTSAGQPVPQPVSLLQNLKIMVYNQLRDTFAASMVHKYLGGVSSIFLSVIFTDKHVFADKFVFTDRFPFQIS